MSHDDPLVARLRVFSADTVLVNGIVLTMDRCTPRGSAVAVAGGRIVGVGGDREIRQFVGPATEVIDLDGRTLLPGFVESHTHVSAWSHTILQVDGSAFANDSIGDILDRVAERARSQSVGTWIEGYGYDDTMLADQRHLTRWDLDKVAPDHPVHFWHISGHFTAVNSRALELAGIDRDTSDPDGGVIYRDDDGEPTGLLGEPGIQVPVLHLIPPKSVDERARGMKLVAYEYVKAGVTSAHDANLGVFGGMVELEAMDRAREKGEFPIRVYALLWFMMLESLIEAGMPLSEAGLRTGAGDEWLRVGGVKIWADGSIPGLTAAVTDPYLKDPSQIGKLNHSPEKLAALVAKYHDAGFQLAIHANGERGIDATVAAYEAALAANPRPDHRHRIEHLSLPTPELLDRMAAAGVATTFYSRQIYGWGDRHREVFLGPERAERIFPMRSALDRGIVAGLHGDSPVTPVSPLTCLYAAVTRRSESGSVLGPTERVSIDEALRALTIDGAYLAFEENIKGSIETGKLADFVVLSADPFEVGPDGIPDIEVMMTMIGGSVVYERE